MMRTLKVGLIQMDCELNQKESNLQKALAYVDQIADNVDVICFPELFTTGYHLKTLASHLDELAETIPGPTVYQFQEKAKQYKSAIIGNIIEKDEAQSGVFYDTTFVINEHGEYQGKYRKVHLYPTEHQYFRSGSQLPVFEICGVKIGNAICYDHGFEEMFRILAMKGAEVIFIPSVIPKNYEYLLNLRTCARAQDNQLFTVAINRVGVEDGTEYCGLSKIANPRGEVICEAGDKEEIVIGTIELTQIGKEREQEPILRSRRPELYDQLVVPS
jgi:predicted amidohydrolase